MTSTQRHISLIISVVFLTSACGQKNKEDFGKVKWVAIDNIFSYSIENKSGARLTDADTIRFHGVGELENNKIIRTKYFDTLVFTLTGTAKTIFRQYQTLSSALSKNAQGYLKMDLTTLYKYAAEDHNKINLYLNENADTTVVKTLLAELKNKPFVDSLSFTSKEKAAKKLETDLGQDFVAFLGYNPLANCIELTIKTKYLTAQDLKKITTELEADKRINSCIYDKFIDLIDKNRHKIIILKISA